MSDFLSTTFIPTILPHDFIKLLKINMNSKIGSYSGFGNFVFSSTSLKSIFETEFRDIDPEGRLEIVFKSLGWEGIKIRLFDFYQEQGARDAEELDQMLVEELLGTLENRYNPFIVEGYSRHSLLFFYSTMLPATAIRDEFWHFLMSRETLNYLKIFNKKSIYIDILLLSLFLFETVLGKDELFDTLKSGGYEDVYTRLNTEQKCEYQKVLLHYTYSIKDDLFHEDNI
jgi:hypothetical protein